MAAEALAVTAFVGVEDPAVLDEVMVHLKGLWKGAFIREAFHERICSLLAYFKAKHYLWHLGIPA
jgi:hypothetical protein